MIWPNPATYKDWKDWAQKLISNLSTTQEATVAETIGYTVAKAPPPLKDGQIIFVTNEVGGATLAVAHQGIWKRVKDGAAIA